ncbi:MAG: hypothetical protein VX265_12345 [Myxococcota bacterium]|nr:hypothetical protein [Myxococcota bacterium]
MGRLSGQLVVSRDGHRRTLHLVEGDPVAFSSTVPGEGIASALVDAAGVSSATADAWVKAASPPVSVLDDRLSAGDLSPEATRATWRAWLGHGVRAPLAWQDGIWVFRQTEGLRSGGVDPSLLPGVKALEVLRQVLPDLVSGPHALAEARERAAAVQPGPRHAQLASEVPLPADLQAVLACGGLLAPLVEGPDPDAVAMARLVWFLARLRIVTPSGAPESDDTLERLRAAGQGEPPALQPRPAAPARRSGALPRPEPAESATRRSGTRKRRRRRTARGGAAAVERPKLTAVVTMLRVDHGSRLDNDHYRFLGVTFDDEPARIRKAIRRLGRRWQDALEDPRLDTDSQGLATELLARLELVREDLGDADRKAAYDDRIGVVKTSFEIDTTKHDPWLDNITYDTQDPQ